MHVQNKSTVWLIKTTCVHVEASSRQAETKIEDRLGVAFPSTTVRGWSGHRVSESMYRLQHIKGNEFRAIHDHLTGLLSH